jgi:hypothetical protein
VDVDGVQSSDRFGFGSPALSRRSAVLGLGSGSLAALLAGGVLSVAAQEASPMAGTPTAERAFLAIRHYQFAPGRTMEELTAAVASGFVPIVREVPGFVEYSLVETDEGVLSISVFADQTGAQESTRRAADWVQQNIADMFAGPPTVTTGSVWLREAGGVTTGAAAP